MYIYVYMCIYSKLQKLWHKTYQHINISRPLYLHFILTSTVREDMLFVFGTFFGLSNVLRLIKVFIVADFPIHSYFTICLDLPKFMQFAICVYICIYVYIYMYI